MISSKLSARLSRLDALAERLADGQAHVLQALAAESGVSLRTLARDVAVLREQGWDIEGSSGRGGGIRIANRWAAGQLTLRSAEAIDLLMSLALAQSMSMSMQDRSVDLRRTVSRCFAPADRPVIATLRQRIRVASPASAEIRATWLEPPMAIRSTVFSAFRRQTLLKLGYVNASGRASLRTVEPQCLLASWPCWYLLAWDDTCAGVRTFRLDRIESAHEEASRFQWKHPGEFWSACADVGISL